VVDLRLPDADGMDVLTAQPNAIPEFSASWSPDSAVSTKR
jgi:hypothetical protein